MNADGRKKFTTSNEQNVCTIQSVEPSPHSPPVTELHSANKWFTNDANNYDALLIC